MQYKTNQAKTNIMGKILTIILLTLPTIMITAQDRLTPAKLSNTKDSYHIGLRDSLAEIGERKSIDGFALYIAAPSFTSEYSLMVNCMSHKLIHSKSKENMYLSYYSSSQRSIEEILEEYDEDELKDLDSDDYEHIRSITRHMPEIKRDTLGVSEKLCLALSSLIDYAVYSAAPDTAKKDWSIVDGTSCFFLSQYQEAKCHSPFKGLCFNLVKLMDKCCEAVSQQDRDATEALLPEIESMTIRFRKLFSNDRPVKLPYHELTPYNNENQNKQHKL